MFLTIKWKILFFVTLVMIISTSVNIYFTNRDVGKAMLEAQEKSALNILYFLDIMTKDDYHNLLLNNRKMALSKRQQLNDSARMIESVFKGYSQQMSNSDKDRSIHSAILWLNSAPFENIDYTIINNASHIIASSNTSVTNENFQGLKDIKHRDISKVMNFQNINKQGDFSVFNINMDDDKQNQVLSYFLPFDPWEITISTSIDISDIEAEAEKEKKKIIESLHEFAKQLDIIKDGFVYMFDASNTVLIPPPEHIENDIHMSINSLTNDTIFNDIKSATSSKTSKFRFIPSSSSKKKAMMVYCHYFKPLKWYTSVIIPVKEINRPALKLVINQSIIMIIMFVTGLIAVYLLVHRIATPLNLLSVYARKIPKEDFTQPIEKETPIDELPGKYRDEVGALASSFIFMREELSKNIQDLISVTASRQRIESELTIARDIQLGMVPKTFPSFPEYKEFDLFATLKPAKEIGGDLYDFFLIDKDHLAFTLGDVSDKGIPAALLMVVTRTLVRTLSEKDHSPSKIIHRINNILSVDNPRSMFVTLIIGTLNINTGEVKYANGGHNPAIVVSKDSNAYFNNDKTGPLVGIMPDMSYPDNRLTLKPGESLFLYTDGVNEAMNPKGEQYSNERFLAKVEENREKTVEEIIGIILDNVDQHSDTAPQSDDIAMLMIKYYGK